MIASFLQPVVSATPLTNSHPAPCPHGRVYHHHSLPSSVQVCKDIRIFDEDEGCGVYEDSVVFGADGNGNQAARKLPWDLLHDSACFNVQVYPKPPPPPKPAAPAAPAPLPPLPPSSEITQKNGDVVTINTPRSMVGVRVGSCMCPDGKMYEVGDANKGKGDCAPACYGGISKKDQCKASNDGASSHNQVKCSEKHGELAEDALDDHEKYEEALKQAKAMLTEKKSDGTLKYPKGKEDEKYKEKVQEAMKWLAASKA